jgi:hypothetical protein
MVGAGDGADVAHRPLVVGGDIEERARADARGYPVQRDLEGARLDDEELVARVSVAGRGACARGERRDVALEAQEGEGRRVKDLAVAPSGRIRDAVAVDDARGEHPLRGPFRGRLVAGRLDGIRVEIDDVIGGGPGAHVRDVVHVVRRDEAHGARPGALLFPVDRQLELPLLDEEDLLPGMMMRRVRGHPGIERRHVDLELLERRGGLVEDGAGEPDRGHLEPERIPGDHRRTQGSRPRRRRVGNGGGFGKSGCLQCRHCAENEQQAKG